MSELRKDPILGRWIIISTERSKRPNEFEAQELTPEKGPCPFCEGHESETPPEIFAIREPGTKPNTPGWQVRVVPSISPLLRPEGKLTRWGKGIYDVMSGVGAHEIIVETPQHISNIAELDEAQVARVITSYVERLISLEKDHRFKYVLIFKNYKVAAGGSSIRHSRSQIIAMPINPKRVKEELAGAKLHFSFKERCVYCDIIRQELDFGDRIISEHNDFIAFAPFASRFPFEVWIIPKKHSPDFTSLSEQDRLPLAKTLKTTLLKLSRSLNDPPYNYVLHTAPFRRPTKEGYWKTVDEDFHWHLEIMPRLTRVAGFEWGSGFYINPTSPEELTRYLRQLQV